MYINTIFPLYVDGFSMQMEETERRVGGHARWQANMHSKSIQIDPFRAQVMHGECNFMIARVDFLPVPLSNNVIDNDMMAKWN